MVLNMRSMRRRDFIAGLMAAPTIRAAIAQQPAKMKRIAMVHPSRKVGEMTINGPIFYKVFFEELSRLGYIEGQNLAVERYSGEGQPERYAGLAREVVGSHPDLIFALSGSIALAFKPTTTTIPIVAMTADPIALGLVPSVAHPGGDITGVTSDAGMELYGKRLGLLAEAIPKLSNAGYLASRAHWERPSAAAAREAAKQAGIAFTGELLVTFNEGEYRRAVATLKQDRVDAIMVSDEGEHVAYRELLVELIAESAIPAMYPYREFVEVGGLMAYSVDLLDMSRRVARQIAEILQGTRPGDIPFYQPTRFDLWINLKTAKALGLEIPATLLARADNVIE
jgi:putative tryptophan/tyrosine transport system substrate-binding protein